MIPSYGKVWALGHKETLPLLDGSPVVVQEKVDGSQFSFARFDGKLYLRSKGQDLTHEGAERNNMFGPAIEHLHSVESLIPEGIIFRAETLARPKHNTLQYERVPAGHLVLFDATDRYGSVIEGDLFGFAELLGVEAVPTLERGLRIFSPEQVKDLLERESFLGGVPIEGVVVKRYDAYDSFGHFVKGKFVSERFKEAHHKDWRGRNPNTADIVTNIVQMYRTEARWEKAVQHLREQGQLEGSPRDIGPLIKRVTEDVLEECRDEIADTLFKHFWRKGIGRGVSAGLAEWYKERLLTEGVEAAA